MAQVDVPRFGALLAPFISQVPAHARPRFLALLERGAAARYRQWALMLPDHTDTLLTCAQSEDEIADLIEQAFPLDSVLHDAVHALLSGALDTYAGVFTGLDPWDQLRIQANAERQGADAWRSIATQITDPSVREALHACSTLEEASADRLDELIQRYAPMT